MATGCTDADHEPMQFIETSLLIDGEDLFRKFPRHLVFTFMDPTQEVGFRDW